jgi:hypothetical protein
MHPNSRGSVSSTSRLAADSQLDDDVVRAIERDRAIPRENKPAGPAVAVEDSFRETAHHVQALLVDVVQDKLVDRQSVAAEVKSFDQLGCVGAPAADHSNLHAHFAASYATI